jgi:hypothetical protein
MQSTRICPGGERNGKFDEIIFRVIFGRIEIIGRKVVEGFLSVG